jgi:hypothetical protein
MAGAWSGGVRDWSGSSSLSETTGKWSGLAVVEGKHISGYFDRVCLHVWRKDVMPGGAVMTPTLLLDRGMVFWYRPFPQERTMQS